MSGWSGWGWAVCTLQWILCSPVEMSLNKSITIIHGLKHMKSKSSTNSHSDEARTRSEHNILMLNKDSECLKWNHDQQQKTQGNLYANCIMSNFKSFIQMQILEDTVFCHFCRESSKQMVLTHKHRSFEMNASHDEVQMVYLRCLRKRLCFTMTHCQWFRFPPPLVLPWLSGVFSPLPS